jgi:hypothetical protein
MVASKNSSTVTIYSTRWFQRWARKQGLDEASLCKAVVEMSAGLFDADLGAGLFKKRIARKGQGKSAGFRTLVATNRANRWFFVYGFSKNERGNIDEDEEAALKKLAPHLLSLTQEATIKATQAGELFEVTCDEKSQIPDPGRRA